MARVDADRRRELGAALVRARKAAGFSNAHDFLEAMRAEQGAAPSYSTYAQWESGGVGARDESLAPVRRFHEQRGTWEDPTPEPDLAAAIRGLTAELANWRRERDELRSEVEQLKALVGKLAEERLSAPDREGSAAPAARPGSVR